MSVLVTGGAGYIGSHMTLGLIARGEDEVLWISRMSVSKGTFVRSRQRSSGVFAREYAFEPLRDLVRGVLRNAPSRLSGLDLATESLSNLGGTFPEWIESSDEAAVRVRDYLTESSDNFDLYLADAVGSKKRAVLIDSGWQGTTQSLLASAFKDVEWLGLYFGRILSGSSDPSITSKVIGLMFEANSYEPMKPETAFTVYPHLIECLLEPNGLSIEDVPFGSTKSATKKAIASNLRDTASESEVLYRNVVEYLQKETYLSLSEIEGRYTSAMKELTELLVSPSREQALALRGKPRSKDFGKTGAVPVLRLPVEFFDESSSERIRKSLWGPGQIALEYDAVSVARKEQKVAVGLADESANFNCAVDGTDRVTPSKPLISIITRTKDRPLLLERAARSVRMQAHSAIEWIVVNDGGDETEVRQVIERSGVDPRRLKLISNQSSVGMEGASNLGIKSASGSYILIHDDDDSLESDFCSTCVDFLESPAGKRYGGVITHGTYVSEEIVGDTVIVHEMRPYMDWVRNIFITEMAVGNIFAPIQFVYRRSAYDQVGGYNESLPVLGDWYFNLEFLLKADIAVIPCALANYHHRDRGGSNTSYSNSVTAAISKHEEFTSVVVNDLLRKHSAKNPAILAVSQGYLLKDTRHRLQSLSVGVGGRPDSAVRPPDVDHQAAHGAFHTSWVVAEVSRGLLSGRVERQRLNELVEMLNEQASCDALATVAHSAGCSINVPPYFFDEEAYLARNPDVKDAVTNGIFPSGYMHYVQFGLQEGRRYQ